MQPTKTQHIPPMSTAPEGFSIERDLPPGFGAFYKPLHDLFTPGQQQIIANRKAALEASLKGKRPRIWASAKPAAIGAIELPAWCADQRNQMTGPADDHELIVKMLNSGAPGVMIDLEDSMANVFSHTLKGIDNAVAAYYGDLTYTDAKRGNADRVDRRRAGRFVDARARTASLASRHLQRRRRRRRCSTSRCWRISSISRA